MKDPSSKYRRPKNGTEDEEIFDLSAAEGKTYLAYRSGNKVKRLILRPARGDSRAPAYSYLVDVVWDAERGDEIGLMFSHATARIRGQNLLELAQLLAGEKVLFIRAFDPARWDQPAENEPRIDSIEYVTEIAEALGSEKK